MAQEIQVFNNPSFGDVRTVISENGTLLFVASDVAKALGYAVPQKAVLDHCKHCSKMEHPTSKGTLVNLIPESDVYRLTMKSKLPNAEQFQDWVCDEVLPSIRKTGTYSVQQQFQLPQTYLEALKALVASEEEKQQLAIENKVMRPKAEYFDKLIDRNLLTNIRDTAKQIHIPQNRFVKWLLDKRFVYRDAKRKLKPYAEYIPEYFELKDFERNGHADTQLLINPKGKETFRLMIAGE